MGMQVINLRSLQVIAKELLGLGVLLAAVGLSLYLVSKDPDFGAVSGAAMPPPADSAISFAILDRGGASLISRGDAGNLLTGYGRMRVDIGTTPSGFAIFGFQENGVLISEAAVPASPLIQVGRIYAEVDGPVNTGIAVANPNGDEAVLSFFYTDSDGNDFGNGTLTLGPNQQIARFLSEDPFNSSTVNGTFTFTSSVPVSVVALRGLTNERSDFLMTTLPVVPLAPASDDTIFLPHFADGGGWTTQVVLVNPTDSEIAGTVLFLDGGDEGVPAQPLTLALQDGRMGPEFSYEVPPRSSRRLQTANPASLSVGSVRVVRDPTSSAPSALIVFSAEAGGITVTEAGVPASPDATAFRMYAEVSGTPGEAGSLSSGLAITNAGATQTTVSFELTTLDGVSTGLAARVPVPGSGHVSMYVDELFPALTLPFRGILRLSSASESVAVVGLRLRSNENGDLLVTTTPPIDESSASTTSELLFPHLVDGGGWITEFVLFSGVAGQAGAGELELVDSNGQPPARLLIDPSEPNENDPGSEVRLIDISVVTDSAATGNYNNAWGGNQHRVVRNSAGVVFTEFIVPDHEDPDARRINVARRGEDGWEVIDSIPIGGTPGHLLTGPDDRLHLVVWAGWTEEQGHVELWTSDSSGENFVREEVPGAWHSGDPLYGGAGINADGDVYVVACFGGGEPGGHFEWNSRDAGTGRWEGFSIVELDYRYAYPYVLPGTGGFSVAAGRDVVWEALGYDRPCPDCEYAFDAVGTWSYSNGDPRHAFLRVDIHEEPPTPEFPGPSTFSNYSGDAYIDSGGRVHVVYTVEGASTGGIWQVRHAVIEGGTILLDAELPGGRGQPGALIEDSQGRLYLLKYGMDSSPEDAELVVFAAEDDLGATWSERARLPLDGHVIRYSGVTLASPRGGTGLADIVDGAYPSGTDDGPDWVHFRVQLR